MTLRVDAPGDKAVNVETCVCKPYNPETKTEKKLSKRLKEFLKKSWAFRSKVTVEPFVICYILPSVLAGLAVQNLCLEKSCLVNLQYDERTCRHIMQGRTLNYTEQEKKVQTMVAEMTAWSFPLQTALPGILTLFLGAWSDRTGNRKAFMVLPILGKLISVIGIILSTVFFFQVGLNETALLEGLPPALAGGRVAMTMAVYSYITDITSETERTYRLGIITAILTLSRPIGLALSGIMTKRFGYYGVFTVACVFYLIGFVYIVIRLKEKPKKAVDSDKQETILSVFSAQDFVATVNVAFKPREGSRRLQIILIMFAYMFIVGPVLGEAQMTYWFTRYKFKFTEVDYSLFLTYSVLVGSVGVADSDYEEAVPEPPAAQSSVQHSVGRLPAESYQKFSNPQVLNLIKATKFFYKQLPISQTITGSFLTIYLFSKRWKVEDSIIGVMACLSRIAASVVYAMAPTRTVYFLGPLLDMFSSAGATSLRSIATKLVHKDEVGKTSSLISISEALVPVIYSPMYSKVYLSTLTTFSGAFYLISAALAVPAIVLLIVLYSLRKDDGKSADGKPKEREVTRF